MYNKRNIITAKNKENMKVIYYLKKYTDEQNLKQLEKRTTNEKRRLTKKIKKQEPYQYFEMKQSFSQVFLCNI